MAKKMAVGITPNVFKDPELTDGQGRPVEFRYSYTAWGGHILYPPPIDAVFTAAAYKRFLSWLVAK